MSVSENFESWFQKLTDSQKKEVVEHVIKKHAKPLNEGVYGGPVGMIKGIFAGPAGQTSDGKCSCCGK